MASASIQRPTVRSGLRGSGAASGTQKKAGVRSRPVWRSLFIHRTPAFQAGVPRRPEPSLLYRTGCLGWWSCSFLLFLWVVVLVFVFLIRVDVHVAPCSVVENLCHCVALGRSAGWAIHCPAIAWHGVLLLSGDRLLRCLRLRGLGRRPKIGVFVNQRERCHVLSGVVVIAVDGLHLLHETLLATEEAASTDTYSAIGDECLEICATRADWADLQYRAFPDQFFFSVEVGPVEVGPGEVGSVEVGAGEVDSGAVGPGEVGPVEVGPVEVGPGEVGPGEVGPVEVGPGEVGPVEVGPAEVGPGEVGPGEVGPVEVGPGEVGPGEVGPGFYGSL